MTNYRKKMIEVVMPLEAINKESAREKSSGTDIRRRCTSGGPAALWPPAARSSSAS
jgi:hypothetical protein